LTDRGSEVGGVGGSQQQRQSAKASKGADDFHDQFSFNL
jgi:hypothetical protein